MTDLNETTDLEEVTPTCDICGEPEDQDPTNGGEYDWNGETGNHQSCEARIASGFPPPLPDRFIGFLVGQLLNAELFEYPNGAQYFARKVKKAWDTSNGW